MNMPRGYDNDPITSQLLLDLQFQEGTGTLTQDWAKPRHTGPTLTGPPAWTDVYDLSVLDFNPATPDYVLITQANSVDLDFTAGDFTVLAWIEPDALGNRNIFCRGATLTDGWQFWLNATGGMVLTTSQAGVDQHTIGDNLVAINTWVLVAAVRSGAVVRIYINGADSTLTPDTHIDPLTAARGLYIGTTDLAAAGWYDGAMWRPRIWGRALEAAEMKTVFERERDKFSI